MTLLVGSDNPDFVETFLGNPGFAYAARYAAVASGTASSIVVRLNGSTENQAKVAIYNAAGNAILAESGQQAIVFGLNVFSIPDTPIVLGTEYIIAAFVDGYFRGYLQSGMPTQTAATFPTFPVPLNVPALDTNGYRGFADGSSGPTITNAGDESYRVGETGVTISGSNFGATQGTGFVRICPSDDVDDVNGVNQTVTSWATDSITIDIAAGTLARNTNLYLFVQTDGGPSNASGYVVQLTPPIAVLAAALGLLD